MAHRSCKDVCYGLQIHRHEASVARSHATNLVSLYVGVFFAELLGALNDVVSRVIAIGINVARSKLLTETAATRRLNDVNHITHRCPFLIVVVAVEVSTNRRTTAIVINEHGVLLRFVKEWRQIVATINRVAPFCLEVPVLAFTKLNVLESCGIEVAKKLLFACLEVAQPTTVCTHATFPYICEEWLLFSQTEAAINIRFGKW